MKWIANAHGDKRVIKRFLFFPRTINGLTRWLEFAEIRQFYHEYYVKHWRDEQWTDL